MPKYKLLFLLITFSLPAIGQETPEAIFKKATDQLLVQDMELSIDIKETLRNKRVKEKSFDVLIGKFGTVEKTKMHIQKPQRAKGVTIVVTQNPAETGIIEIFTPANGKTRKLKATPRNLALVGASSPMSNYTSKNQAELSFTDMGKREINTKTCYMMSVKEKNAGSDKSKAEFLIEENTFHIIQIISYNEKGNKSSITKLSDFQSINGVKNKIQPMLISSKSLEENKSTEIKVLNVKPRPNLTKGDFNIENIQK